MFSKTDNRTSVRMFTETFFEHQFHESSCWFVAVHVLFFINGFKFALEETEDWIAETFYIYVHPFLNLIRRETVEIDSHVVRCTGVETFAAHLGENQVNLVRNSVVCRSD